MRDPIRFGRYLLLDRVDVGGMAEVFAARVLAGEGAGGLVAVKRLLPTVAEEPELVSMFLDEARIAAQLDHRAIARVLDLGRQGAAWFIAMEYVDGRSLKSVLDLLVARSERWPVPLAAYVGARMLEALEHAHARRGPRGDPLGIVHRDVSPHNVLLSYGGEVKLIDFGLARGGGRGAAEEPGLLRGKVGYLSPEQVRGQAATPRSDVFSAAVVLHELLAGERLFAAGSRAEAADRVLDPAIPSLRERNPEVPEPLARAVLDALERDPGRRTGSAAVFRAAVAPHAAPGGAAELGAWLAARFPAPRA